MPPLTREQARRRAEVLRLRLGLAGYKVRTGQQDVPLERLQVRRGFLLAPQRDGTGVDGAGLRRRDEREVVAVEEALLVDEAVIEEEAGVELVEEQEAVLKEVPRWSLYALQTIGRRML